MSRVGDGTKKWINAVVNMFVDMISLLVEHHNRHILRDHY